MTRTRVDQTRLLSPEAMALLDDYHARMAEATAEMLSGLRELERAGRLCSSKRARSELQRVIEDAGAAKYLMPYLGTTR